MVDLGLAVAVAMVGLVGVVAAVGVAVVEVLGDEEKD